VNNYNRELEIDTSPEKLYNAIATQEGLEHWWTEQTEVYPRVGGIATFYFGKEKYVVMKITKLLPNKEIVWKCVEQKFPLQGTDITDEWVGTTIKISIAENKEGATMLTFAHNGLTPDLSSYNACTQEWDYYLNSLKEYLETGKGKPFSYKA
jgi:uncharacterized protein YndB with AHSA1/START domain